MPDRTRPPPPRADVETTRGAWFRQPVVWLGGLIFVVSLGACMVTIVLASRHADVPVDAGARVMGVPVRDAVAAPSSAPSSSSGTR
jgi:hypothetical protein